MSLPFVVVLVSPCGGVFCLRYERNEGGDGLEAVPLAEHGDPAGFASPVNMLIVDQTGEAIRVAITDAGLTTYH